MTKVTGIKLIEKNGKILYEFYPIEFGEADKKFILHGVVSCIVLNTDGKFLRIKRSKRNYLLANFNTIPAGHMEFGESIKETGLKELWEETKLKPIYFKRIFSNRVFIGDLRHFSFVYLFLVDKNDKPIFDSHEINRKESGFENIETIIKKLNTEKFTPLSSMILTEFVKKYPTKKKVLELIKKLNSK